ncbi:MAG: hypothetical protein Q9M39_09070 [Sulfurovum sp.]|nr:hypothetical protein [Sulfurovum sp.]
MIKINITKEIEQHFTQQIDNIFKNGKLEKKKDKKTIFNISKKDINNLLQKKLKKFDENINLGQQDKQTQNKLKYYL